MLQLSDLDLTKTYSYADYYSWKFDERVELIDGKVYEMMSAPSRWHQEYTTVIIGEFYIYLRDKTPCQLFAPPFDVRIPGKDKNDKNIFNVFQPDVCVVCDPSKLDDRGCIGAPDIVVEVLSPGNTKKEMELKFAVYERGGVKEYWVVYPKYQQVVVFVLIEGKFLASIPKTKGQFVTTPILPGFSLDISKLFKDLPDYEDD